MKNLDKKSSQTGQQQPMKKKEYQVLERIFYPNYQQKEYSHQKMTTLQEAKKIHQMLVTDWKKNKLDSTMLYTTIRQKDGENDKDGRLRVMQEWTRDEFGQLQKTLFRSYP